MTPDEFEQELINCKCEQCKRKLLVSGLRKTRGIGKNMTRPSAAEQDRLLSGYAFEADVIVERIDIEKDGHFEFFLFAAWDPKTDEVRLFTMWPKDNSPTSEWT